MINPVKSRFVDNTNRPFFTTYKDACEYATEQFLIDKDQHITVVVPYFIKKYTSEFDSLVEKCYKINVYYYIIGNKLTALLFSTYKLVYID